MHDQVRHYEKKLKYEIDSWDLHDGLANGDNIVVIDARSSEAFASEHIKAAINMPHREMNEESTAHFNQSTLYVTYCDGIGCNASTKGTLNMVRLGFRVKELLGGLDWWKRDGYTTESDGLKPL